jgi:hypothetical protein
MVEVEPMLDARTLGFQTSLSKLTMKSNSKGAMEEPRDRNPLTKLWAEGIVELAHGATFVRVHEGG